MVPVLLSISPCKCINVLHLLSFCIISKSSPLLQKLWHQPSYFLPGNPVLLHYVPPSQPRFLTLFMLSVCWHGESILSGISDIWWDVFSDPEQLRQMVEDAVLFSYYENRGWPLCHMNKTITTNYLETSCTAQVSKLERLILSLWQPSKYQSSDVKI